MTDRLATGLTGQLLFILLTVGNISSSTELMWTAANGGTVLQVVPYCLLTWTCYFGGHYLVAGEIVDETSAGGSTIFPDARLLRICAVAGLTSMVLAFPTGIVAVRSGSFWLLYLSLTLFVGGYTVGHYGITQKLL